MLTTDAFHAWCHRLRLAPETADRIAAIRSAPPVRRVTGRAGNVAGRYPSPKMHRTIQFESQHVELWAIYAMERDDDVVEYYDQPGRMPLRYRAVSGRATTQWHTPDFFVLRQDSAGWEEWKPLHALEVLAVRMPARYGQTPAGQWHCPPGEAYAEPLGLTYRVRSSAENHPLYIQNLKFLQDFWAHPAPVDPEQERLVLGHVAAHPGLCLTDLRAAYPRTGRR
jgi:putative transposase